MTAKEQQAAIEERTINGEGFVTFDKLTVKVRVIDSRKSFGRDDVLITPVNGSGEQWIDLTRVHQ
ncbi:MAG: hypothetical protein LLG05_12520 [Porphyromonadaceae bacterium]|nr:hypothetical protein [Porphyromonadaceae bacterium]